MSKSLYSLILSDEVVSRIDRAAVAGGTNRSNLINQILAEYVSYTTPEKRIRSIFEHLDNLLSASVFQRELASSDKCISLKTSLECKYRPTVRYGVELYRTVTNTIGELKVTYRTHSEELLDKIHKFLSELVTIEKKYLSCSAIYTLTDGKFSRTFVIPDGTSYSLEETARAIGDYVKTFDMLLKNYLADKYRTESGLENEYKIYMSKSILI